MFHLHMHTGVLATVMPAAVALTLTQSVTACTILRETTVSAACPSTTTSHGDTVPQTTPSPASPVTVTTTPLAVTTMSVWTPSQIAMRWEGEGCVMTARTILVRSYAIFTAVSLHA